MRLAAICRVMDEEDIIEAFIRHTLAHVDHLLLLDNGSTDRTVEIMRSLKAEGAALTVLQVRTPIFHELQHNTLLYGVANTAFKPDWVLPLDADEFLDTRAADLRERLAAVERDVPAVKLPQVEYFSRGLDRTDPLVPRRMRLRELTDRGIRKCFVRGGQPGQVTVDAGSYGIWVDGQPARATEMPEPRLAHYPLRHPVARVAKAALGRLKVLAAGNRLGVMAQHASHYAPILDALCRNPAEIFDDPGRMNNALPNKPLVDDPIHYAGGELRYTLATDPTIQAIRAIANAAALLAASHGHLLDEHADARSRLEEQAVTAQLLFG